MKGFYMLGSGLLTQSRRLNAVSNNIANANTAGYKKESVSAASFGSLLVQRTGSGVIGETSLRVGADGMDITATEGILQETGRSLDFAIAGEGFFALQGGMYTRSGSFAVDADGYLVLPGGGRVLSTDGVEIWVGGDDVTLSENGMLSMGNANMGQLAVYNLDNLQPVGNGIYTGENVELVENPAIRQRTLELSNVTALEEMTSAIQMQRQMQTVAQAIKMYDTMQSKSNEIGKI